MGCLEIIYPEQSSELKIAHVNPEFEEKTSKSAYRGLEYRIHDARVGRWLSPDPHKAKFSYVNPYNFVLNNPIYFVDPDGLEVRVAGDIKKAEQDMKSTLPAEYQSKLKVVDNKLVFDITREEAVAAKDPVVYIMYALIESDKVYQWNVSDEVTTIDPNTGKVVTNKVEGIRGSSQKGDRWPLGKEVFEKGKRKNGKPIYGIRAVRKIGQTKPLDPDVDYQRTINPDYEGPDPDNPRESRVTHEILEFYLEGELNLPYSTHIDQYDGPEVVGAHNGARIIQSVLKDSRRGSQSGSEPTEDKNGLPPKF